MQSGAGLFAAAMSAAPRQFDAALQGSGLASVAFGWGEGVGGETLGA